MPAPTDAVKLLAENPLFTGVAPAALQQMLLRSRRSAFKADATIFAKGQRADCVYAVLSGCVSVGSTSEQGHVIFHRIFQSGELFGELGVFDGGPRTADARTQEPSELVGIPRAAFMQLVERCPAIAARLLALLSSRLRSTSQMLEDTLFVSGRNRVGRVLLQLAGFPGRTLTRDSITLRHLTQEQLGTMVGLSRQHVCSQLRWLRSERVIETGHGRIVLLDPHQLAVLCGALPATEPRPEGPGARRPARGAGTSEARP